MRKCTVHIRHRLEPANGFTLVELLVVISIIAMLIAILLPSLGKARDQAKTVVCATRIKGILTAMSLYATDNNDFIAGSPSTSGSMLYTPEPVGFPNPSVSFEPSPVQVWDWGGGMARDFNMKLSPKPWADRFNEIRTMKAFACPSNSRVKAERYQMPWDAGIGPLVSYNTCRTFMWPALKSLMARSFPNAMGYGQSIDPRWNELGRGWLWSTDRNGNISPSPDDWSEHPNRHYTPRVDKVGAPAEKVYIADGSRYSSAYQNERPTYNGDPYAKWGGSFSDVGAYSNISRSWTRVAIDAGNNSSIVNDPRQWSYRHGKKEPFLPLGNYKMNVGFFDNHVEAMNDITSANPHMWIPKGYTLQQSQYQGEDVVAQDVIDKYFPEGDEFLLIR